MHSTVFTALAQEADQFSAVIQGFFTDEDDCHGVAILRHDGGTYSVQNFSTDQYRLSAGTALFGGKSFRGPDADENLFRAQDEFRREVGQY